MSANRDHEFGAERQLCQRKRSTRLLRFDDAQPVGFIEYHLVPVDRPQLVGLAPSELIRGDDDAFGGVEMPRMACLAHKIVRRGRDDLCSERKLLVQFPLPLFPQRTSTCKGFAPVRLIGTPI